MICVKVPPACGGGYCIECALFKTRVRKVPPPEEPGVKCQGCGGVSCDPMEWMRWTRIGEGRTCFSCMRKAKPHAPIERPKRKPKLETTEVEQPVQ